MALVVVTLMFLVMGIAEVGWAFMQSSMIVHAARDGARFGATMATAQRDANGCLTGGGTSTITTHVNAALDTIGFSGTPHVSQNTCAANGIPTITVEITGTMQTLFNLMGSSFNVDRSITFEDENRSCPSAC